MAITYTEQFVTIEGDKIVGLAKVTYDASATTVALPCGTIELADVLYGVGSNPAGVTVSWSDDTLTFSSSGTSGRTNYVFWMGV